MSVIFRKQGRQITRMQFESILKRYIVFLKQQLHLKYDIPIILVDDLNFAKKIAAFGEISDKNVVHISIVNRHPVDILRTVAHEYTHYKQHVEKGVSHKVVHVGSATENQANAKAGELIRKYGDLHPELFDLMPIR